MYHDLGLMVVLDAVEYRRVIVYVFQVRCPVTGWCAAAPIDYVNARVACNLIVIIVLLFARHSRETLPLGPLMATVLFCKDRH